MRIINLVIIFILLSLILPDATTADSAECEKAVKLADEIIEAYPNSKSARWVAKDALRELSGHKFRQ